MGERHDKDYVIIVAGGKGLRMGGPLPKQFMAVGGKPVLMRTIERFRAYSHDITIILVLPQDQQDFWKELCAKHDFNVELLYANGGDTRFSSVRNGLALIPDNAQGVVGVHDGVRPFPSIEVIEKCYETARRTGAAIPVTPVVETLRRMDGTTVQRSDYRLVQTPQVFSVKILKEAYQQTYREGFTDDASVVEAAGHTITLVDGNKENIKITTPFDMVVAEALVDSEVRQTFDKDK
jgi:2-C-methyl-D-erythritol 4-phosphate cytidylyltransferase